MTRAWRLRRTAICGVLIASCLLVPTVARAQELEPPSWLGDIAKRVVIDPTTYLPAIVAYDAERRDWQTSQPFFQHGYLERNPRFTLSGLPNSQPLSYSAGNRQVLLDALLGVETSVVNNVASNAIERALVQRYPEHRKLWRAISWAERISFASYMTYHLSVEHYRQAQWNGQVAQQQGW